MPNGHDRREFGPHKYPDHDGTSDCENHCGCWAGPTRSGGPVGLDPLHGKCPANPLDGKPRNPKEDYEDVVTQRIEELQSRAYAAEEKLRKVDPDKLELAEQVSALKRDLQKADKVLDGIRQLIDSVR